ncbi:hypothetical protein STEG23_000336, partial [Scotinomys teguina]
MMEQENRAFRAFGLEGVTKEYKCLTTSGDLCATPGTELGSSVPGKFYWMSFVDKKWNSFWGPELQGSCDKRLSGEIELTGIAQKTLTAFIMGSLSTIVYVYISMPTFVSMDELKRPKLVMLQL